MINLKGQSRFVIGVAMAVMLGFGNAQAQEPTDEHVKAAFAAVSALGVTDEFDGILPTGAEALKRQLIQAAPHLATEIEATVDEQALELAPRRADLEREVATIYARNFSIEELKTITEFYGSDVGQKLLETGPRALRETVEAAEIWSNGIARDLSAATNAALDAKLAPAEGTEQTQEAPAAQ